METGISLGIDVFDTDGRLPVPFAVPYQLTDIDERVDYVIRAEVGDESGTTWQNRVGVPVITKDNASSEVDVVVTEIIQAAPSPSPTPTPAPTPAPTPRHRGRGRDDAARRHHRHRLGRGGRGGADREAAQRLTSAGPAQR